MFWLYTLRDMFYNVGKVPPLRESYVTSSTHECIR